MGSERRGAGWSASGTVDGLRTVVCESWAGYVDFINGALLDFRGYVFRGHSSPEWRLEPTLDRILKERKSTDRPKLRSSHLLAFQYAARGRRGVNPAVLKDENDWWALGQHHGLATPLLDWTESPYVAAYFSMYANSLPVGAEKRVVFALSRFSVEKATEAIVADRRKSDGVLFVRPFSDDNQRLITQRGLFTRAPNGQSIERWIAKHYGGVSATAKLIRIELPSECRAIAMKSLNRMNINHLSLFPDLYGSAKYCNFELSIENY